MEKAMIVAVVALAWVYFGGFLNHNKYSKFRDMLSETVKEEYDYVIVGGGTAGSVLAARLSENKSVTVVLLEAGGFFDEDERFHSLTDVSVLKGSKYDWSFYTEPQTSSSFGFNEKRSFWSRGRVLGGSSVLGTGEYTRGSSRDFDKWATTKGCKGWSYSDIQPYFLKSEDIFIDSLKGSEYHKTGGPMGVSEGRVTEFSELFLEAGKEMGYNVVDYNGASLEGVNKVQLLSRKGTKESTSLRYLGRPIRRINLDIVVHTLVTKILVEDKRATGVTFIRNGRKSFVKARKEIILSAGAINSPQLLMLSGIGHKEHLQNMDIPVVADLPVGDNLQDHLTVPLFVTLDKGLNKKPYQLTEAAFVTSGSEVSAFLKINGTKDLPYIKIGFMGNIVKLDGLNLRQDIRSEIENANDDKAGFTFFVTASNPRSTGSVRLRSSDPTDQPLIDPSYLTDNMDIYDFISGIRFVENFIRTKSLSDNGFTLNSVKMSFCSQFDFSSDAYWECITRHLAMTSNHASCTCQMGPPDDPSSVVDLELRVKGIQGLRVVDASVFPNITSGDVIAPVIMVAEKAADLILGRHSEEYFTIRVVD